MSESSQTPKPLSRLQILKLVVMTVLGTLVAWYLSAALSFAGNTYGFNNRFTEVAIKLHWWYPSGAMWWCSKATCSWRSATPC